MPVLTLNKVVAYVRRLTDGESHGSDRELLDRFARNRDESAFAELVRRHGPMVLAACRRVLRHEQDAEDAFQAAFLVLARKADSIRDHGSAGGWLYQVAHRVALRAKALAERRRALVTPLDGDLAGPMPDDAGVQTFLDEELARLPELYRSAVVLCYLEGKSQSEAARLLATTADAVNSRLKRARELLRHKLARHGAVLSTAVLVRALTASAGEAGLTSALIAHTAQAALHFVAPYASVVTASTVAVELAQGVLQTMITAKIKVLSLGAMFFALLASGALLLPSLANDEPRAPQGDSSNVATAKKPKEEPGKKPRHAIILWMSGGPSQVDTFDPKAGNIALFKAIDTNVKGMQFSEHLPILAKQANHLAVLRGVGHRDGDHMRGTHLMRAGQPAGGIDFPSLSCVLGKELGGESAKLPRLVSIDPSSEPGTPGFGPGFLGAKYGPLIVGGRWPGGPKLGAKDNLPVPDGEAFEELDKKNAAAMRKAIAKAFDLDTEKAAMRDAYGRNRFGNGCLLARRLIEQGVPVVEISLPGWDTHANAAGTTESLSAQLDAGMGALVKDLHERKLLDSTLIVWMGEFGRTPKINANAGRDHWPFGFSVVLAGAGIKGGQAIGKTSADGSTVDEGAVSPQELLATVYQAVGVDPATKNAGPGGEKIPLVERGNNAVKAALR
jgi:RNA polymerase sigma factor (sigma-70 family)